MPAARSTTPPDRALGHRASTTPRDDGGDVRPGEVARRVLRAIDQAPDDVSPARAAGDGRDVTEAGAAATPVGRSTPLGGLSTTHRHGRVKG
jgi:hypothetical protein